MNENKVSIIVAIYNSDKFLRKGLDSLINQTWSNIEVIMMDDGSTDNSGKICDEYSRIDYRFTVVHKQNTGVCDSRNIGLELASGDYVCFMDGDDWFSNDFVEYMMYLINKTNANMVLSDKLFTSFDNKQSSYDKVEIWNSEKTISSIIYPYMWLGPWNKLYSMKVIRDHNVKFPEHSFGETLHFASTVAYYSNYIGVGHRKVYNYRLDNIDSETTKFNVETRLLSIDNITKLENCIFATNTRIHNAIKWHLHTCYFVLLVNIIGCNEISEYGDYYKASINYLRKHGFEVFIKSKVNIKEKITILVRTLFPRLYAKRIVKKIRRRHIRIS